MESLRLNRFAYPLMILMLFACSTTIKLDKPEIIQTALKVGDVVKVETVSNQQHTFKITKIDDSALHGEDVILPFSEISTLEKETTTDQKITGITLFIIFLALISEFPVLGLALFAL